MYEITFLVYRTFCLPAQNESTIEVDKIKREKLIKKYDLLKFPSNAPVFLTLDDFFDGNNDEASIAPNFFTKLSIAEFYKTLKDIEEDKKVAGAYIELKDVNVYNGNQFQDDEWFYTDIVYFIGDITKEEIASKVEKLQPDEVQYVDDERIMALNSDYAGKKIVSVWWD